MCTLAISFFCVISSAPLAEEVQSLPASTTEQDEPRTGLGFRVRGGAVHSLDAQLDGGGKFDTTRAVLEASIRYAFTETSFIGVSAGYSWDGYGFSSGAQIGGQEPWDQIHTMRFSIPMFYDVTDRWRVLGIPIARLTAERTSSWSDGFTGGGIFGFSYRFGDRLRIGPGIGVLSELADDPTIFPVIVIDWQVTDRFRVETGRGLGATEGPGLLASYEFLPWLKTSLGFRYEKLRFRLESNQNAKGNIGEDQSFPVLAGVIFGYPFAELTVIAGTKFGGKLRIEDPDGNRLAESSYDPSFTIGATFQLLF
jgi:hypothetical protein